MNENSPIEEAKKRAVIYARFSTDLQNERSIEDQFSLCRTYADRARENCFDVIIVEALDRLSRDMEDLAGIHKRLSFPSIEIRAVHEGVVNTVLVGLRGLVGQLYREDNANKVRRGLAGRVKQGLSAGGLTYGYTLLPVDAANAPSSKLTRRSLGAFSKNT
jgi:site-specific DNA recombinase